MSQINTVDITSKQLHGTGVFDELMTTIKLRLDGEFKNGRITGDQYSTVFLGSIQSALSESINFLLQRQASDVNARLVEQQILLSRQEVLKSTQEVELLKKQEDKLDADIIHIGKQNDLITQQILLAQQEILKSIQDIEILKKQEDKIDAEVKLYTHKSITEMSQTDLTVNSSGDIIPSTALVTGIVGKQKNLYQGQTDGFKRDAEQKAAKIFADSYAVRRSTDEALIQPKGLRDSVITGAMSKLYKGIEGEDLQNEASNPIP